MLDESRVQSSSASAFGDGGANDRVRYEATLAMRFGPNVRDDIARPCNDPEVQKAFGLGQSGRSAQIPDGLPIPSIGSCF